MKYLKCFKGKDEWKEVTYEKALDTVLGSYKDNAEVRNLLQVEGEIPCMFAVIKVVSDSTR